MNRRHFLLAVLATPFMRAIKPNWIPYNDLQASFYGIDWGLNDATVGTWMGITRSTTPQFHPWVYEPRGHAITEETIALVRKLMDKAIEDNHNELVRLTYGPPQVHKVNNK